MPDFRSLLLIGLCASTPAISDARSEADRSPKPSGVYTLKPGVYVGEDARCQEPANYAIRRYDGKGISTAHTSACIAQVLAKHRNGHAFVYRVRQSCLDTGAGTGKPFTETQTIEIPNASTFSMKSEGGATYHYCPIRELPKWLRNAR